MQPFSYDIVPPASADGLADISSSETSIDPFDFSQDAERFNYLDKVDDFDDQALWNDTNWLVVPDMEYGVEPEMIIPGFSYSFSPEPELDPELASLFTFNLPGQNTDLMNTYTLQPQPAPAASLTIDPRHLSAFYTDSDSTVKFDDVPFDYVKYASPTPSVASTSSYFDNTANYSDYSRSDWSTPPTSRSSSLALMLDDDCWGDAPLEFSTDSDVPSSSLTIKREPDEFPALPCADSSYLQSRSTTSPHPSTSSILPSRPSKTEQRRKRQESSGPYPKTKPPPSRRHRRRYPDDIPVRVRPVQNVPCPLCHSVFSRTADKDRHVNSVHKGTKYPCPDCSRVCSRDDALHRHRNKFHSNVPEEPLLLGLRSAKAKAP